MSRYKVKLVPQGAIPRALEIGVVLTPLPPDAAPPGEECPCVRDWEAWIVGINGPTYTDQKIFPLDNNNNDPIEIRIDLVGELCPGECIEWELVPFVDTEDNPLEDEDQLTVTPDEPESGCAGLTINLLHDDSGRYDAIWFGVYAYVNGEPFGEALVFTFAQNVPCELPEFVGPWCGDYDGPTPPLSQLDGSYTCPINTSFPNGAFTLDVVANGQNAGIACGDGLQPTMEFSGGNPGAYGDFTAVPFIDVGVPEFGFRIAATGDNDYTGIHIQVTPMLIADMVQWGDMIELICAA